MFEINKNINFGKEAGIVQVVKGMGVNNAVKPRHLASHTDLRAERSRPTCSTQTETFKHSKAMYTKLDFGPDQTYIWHG